MKMFVIKKPWCSAQRLIWAFLLAFAAFSALAGNAAAEINFTAPQTLREGAVAEPQVAVDPQGRATLVWEELGPEKALWIQAERVDASGLPGPIQTLAKFQRKIPDCPCPQVAVGPTGRATVVWQSFDGENHRIQAAQIDAAGTAGPVYTLSPAGYDAWDQKVAVDPEGRPTIVWDLPSPQENVETVRFGIDGTPEEVQVLSEAASGVIYPAVGVGPEGRATVVWPTNKGLRTAQIDPSGTPGPIREISPSDTADGIPSVVVDSKGIATIAWWRGMGNYEVRSVRLDPEGVPGTVQTLSPGEGEGALEPRLAIDSQDRVTAVWQTFGERIYAVRLDESGVPETVYPLSEPDREAGLPQVAAAPDGRVVVVWSFPPPFFAPEPGCLEGVEFDPESDVVDAAFLGSDGKPEEIKQVSPFGEQSLVPKVGLNALGLPTVVWESFDGTYFCEGPTTRIQISRGLPVEQQPGPGPEPAPPPPPAPESNGILRLSGKATADNRRLRIHVSCSGGACAGGVKLVRSGVVIARGRFRLAAGQRSTLALALTGFGKKLVAKGSGQLLRTIGGGSGVNKHVVWVRLRGHAH